MKFNFKFLSVTISFVYNLKIESRKTSWPEMNKKDHYKFCLMQTKMNDISCLEAKWWILVPGWKCRVIVAWNLHMNSIFHTFCFLFCMLWYLIWEIWIYFNAKEEIDKKKDSVNRFQISNWYLYQIHFLAIQECMWLTYGTQQK